MEQTLRLDNRLSLCAELVRNKTRVADIGTDHAYLPVWLCLSGKSVGAIAADIKSEPLLRGKKTIEKYNAQALVSTRLSDGLKEISENEADDIVIAGMGGELIAGIIDNAQWTKNKEKHLVLQPMSKAHVLIKYLFDNGFCIDSQKTCTAQGKVYTVISAYYCGVITDCDDVKSYIGVLQPQKSELDRRFIESEINHLKNQSKGDEKFAVIADKLQELIGGADLDKG